MGYDISTCQMQYDANNKETDEKDQCFIYSGWNGPRKRQKYQVPWGYYHKWFAMETHISNICTKAGRALGYLGRNLYACPQEVKEAAYKGLVHPVLEYSSSVWNPSGVGFQDELEKFKIERLGL